MFVPGKIVQKTGMELVTIIPDVRPMPEEPTAHQQLIDMREALNTMRDGYSQVISPSQVRYNGEPSFTLRQQVNQVLEPSSPFPDEEWYALLDFYGLTGEAGASVRYINLTAWRSGMPWFHIAPYGLHCDNCCLATAWKMDTLDPDLATFSDDVAAAIVRLWGARLGAGSEHWFTAEFDRLVAGRTSSESDTGLHTSFGARYADDTDTVWSAQPAVRGIDIALDLATADYLDTPAYRVFHPVAD